MLEEVPPDPASAPTRGYMDIVHNAYPLRNKDSEIRCFSHHRMNKPHQLPILDSHEDYAIVIFKYVLQVLVRAGLLLGFSEPPRQMLTMQSVELVEQLAYYTKVTGSDGTNFGRQRHSLFNGRLQPPPF
jgi:hypothetical protein